MSASSEMSVVKCGKNCVLWIFHTWRRGMVSSKVCGYVHFSFAYLKGFSLCFQSVPLSACIGVSVLLALNAFLISFCLSKC